MATDTTPSTATQPDPGALSPEAGAALLDLLSAPAVAGGDPIQPPAPVIPDPEPADEADLPPAPDLHEVALDDGTTAKVPLEELKKGYYRRQNFDRRVTKLQQEKATFESDRAKELASVKASRDAYAAKLDRMDQALNDLSPAEPDFEKIRAEHGDEAYRTAVADWTVIKDRRAKLTTERQRIQEEQAKEAGAEFQAKLAEEADKLREMIPDLGDEKKAPALKERLLAEGEHRGFSRAEVAQTTDARLVSILHDAMLYRDLVARRDALAKTPSKDAPVAAQTAAAPGTRAAPLPKGRKEAQTAFTRLKESGSVRDAARILESLDL